MKFDLAMTKEGAWTVYRDLSNGQFQALNDEALGRITIRQLLNGPYAFRFSHPKHGQYYFATNDHTYQKLIADGKTVGWLHDLMEAYRVKEWRDEAYFYDETIDDVKLNQILSSDAGIRIVES